MESKIGFIQREGETENLNPYKSCEGNLVRLDISGGIGLTGVLELCEIHGHGYIFSLNPSIIYDADGYPRISERKSLLESNGNALSVFEIGKSIENYASEIKKRVEIEKNKDSHSK